MAVFLRRMSSSLVVIGHHQDRFSSVIQAPSACNSGRNSTTSEDQKTLQQLKHLEVTVYKGLHLNGRNVDTGVVDQWIKQGPYLSADLETTLNHIHIDDYFPGVAEVTELNSLADEIATSWEDILLRLDPGYRVVKSDGDGPEVTFYFDRSKSDTG